MTGHTDMREFLRRMADETGLTPVDPAPVMRKARRRLARTTVIGIACAAVLVAGGFAAVPKLMRATVPAGPPLKNNGMISFVAADGLIRSVEPDGTGRGVLASWSSACNPPKQNGLCKYFQTWSPEGSRIAFGYHHVGGAGFGLFDLFVANADGTGLHRLARECSGCGSLAWSPDGSMLLYPSVDESSANVAFVISADGGTPRVVCTDCGTPVWSPDGARLAAVVGGSLSVGGSNGSAMTSIATIESDHVACQNTPQNTPWCPGAAWQRSQPSWSPDGERIAFLGKDGVYVINADGTDQRRLAELSEGSGGPVWSPDGERIAFQGSDGLYVINADGTDEQRLVAQSRGLSGPVWSPDGRRILYTSTAADDSHVDVHVISVDGCCDAILATTSWGPPVAVWSPDPVVPVWSPDGRFIAFTGDHELTVVNADDSAMRSLARSADQPIAWQAIPS